jgi:osmoprotectant transport system permease protein
MNKALRHFYRLILIILLLAGGVFIDRTGLIEYLSDGNEILYTAGLVWQHIKMVMVSMAIATIIGLSVGILFTRASLKRFSGVIMYIVGLGQTVPSLAVIALAMSFLGIGFEAAVFALFIYSILPIARNTMAGIRSVPPWVIDAAKGMGMPGLQILLHVEIPNAMKVVLTGFRVALVINIGTAALAFLIGAGGLGEHIFTGIDLMRQDKLLAGAIPTALLALLADYLCELLEFIIIPRGLRLTQEA